LCRGRASIDIVQQEGLVGRAHGIGVRMRRLLDEMAKTSS
jgi:4-aminobutyrate aminotransferase-like enzyme